MIEVILYTLMCVFISLHENYFKILLQRFYMFILFWIILTVIRLYQFCRAMKTLLKHTLRYMYVIVDLIFLSDIIFVNWTQNLKLIYSHSIMLNLSFSCKFDGWQWPLFCATGAVWVADGGRRGAGGQLSSWRAGRGADGGRPHPRTHQLRTYTVVYYVTLYNTLYAKYI